MSEWLEYRAKVTGKTVEQLKLEMSERGAKADKRKAALTREANRKKSGYYEKPKKPIQG